MNNLLNRYFGLIVAIIAAIVLSALCFLTTVAIFGLAKTAAAVTVFAGFWVGTLVANNVKLARAIRKDKL